VLLRLRDASIHNIMITGDSELTAFAVARETGMCDKPPLFCTLGATEKEAVWSNGSRGIPADFAALSERFTLCINGAVLDHVKLPQWFFAAVTVWARCSPAHKELITVSLRNCGFHVLMCGDGTNDVGALKQSHVGVALVYTSPAEMEKAATAGESHCLSLSLSLIRQQFRQYPRHPLQQRKRSVRILS
jgi:cation-transporting ATPase 13A1